jgi:hypothetical protein
MSRPAQSSKSGLSFVKKSRSSENDGSGRRGRLPCHRQVEIGIEAAHHLQDLVLERIETLEVERSVQAGEVLEQLRMMLREPPGEEIEAAFPAFRPDARPPARPVFDQGAISQPVDDLLVGRVLKEPDRRPIPVQATQGLPPREDFLEGRLVDVVVPEVG